MSSELYKHIETSIKRNENLLKAQVINFPKEKNINLNNISEINEWKISDKSNSDQLKAVTGICFMLGVLVLAGLYSNFFS